VLTPNKVESASVHGDSVLAADKTDPILKKSKSDQKSIGSHDIGDEVLCKSPNEKL
jgi:hypothetical protein